MDDTIDKLNHFSALSAGSWPPNSTSLRPAVANLVEGGVDTDRAKRQSLRAHIQALAAALAEEEEFAQPFEDGEWLDRLQQYGDFERDDLQLLANISHVALTADAADLCWIVLVTQDPEWVSIATDTALEWHRWPFFWW